MQRREVERWVAGYERAWRTAGTGALGELFAANASYSPAPFREPWRGLDAIRRSWEEEREGPDETFTLTSEVLAVEGDTAVVRVQVRYAEPRGTYRDLWVIEFDADGRCRSFEEWPFWPPGTPGSIAGE